MTEFARREKLNYATFAGWVAKADKPSSSKSPVRFAEVRLPLTPASLPASEQLEVRLPDSTVVRGSGVVELAARVRALRN